MKPRNRKPQRMFFDAMVYVLRIIKTHFDERAMLTHNQKTGQRVIRYRRTTGARTVLGSVHNSRLVYDFKFAEIGEEECEAIAIELGQVK